MRRKPQETADFRRKPQIFCRNRFLPFAVSLWGALLRGDPGQMLSLAVKNKVARLESEFWHDIFHRKTLRAIPPYCALWGFWCHGQLGAIPPSRFSERFPPWRACEVGVRYSPPPPPLKRAISAIFARYPMKTRQMGAIPPSAILSRKGIARYGGVSRTGPLSFRASNLWVREKKIPENSRQISRLISLRKIKKNIHRRAFAGAQGEEYGDVVTN